MATESIKRYFSSLIVFIILTSLHIILLPDSLFAGVKDVDPNIRSKIKVIYPKNNMIIYERRDWVTGITKTAGVEAVNVQVIETETGEEVENYDAEVESNSFFMSPVEYVPGANTIRVEDFTITVYYQEDEDVKPPVKFKEMLVHQSVPELCQECHDIFQERSFPLNEENLIDICENCHKSRIYNRLRKVYKNIHDPVREGNCMQCHEPHISANEHMLKKPQNELCRECHKSFINKVAKAKFVHLGGMFDRICTKCHNPHSSNLKNLIRDVRKGICTKCHEAFSGEKDSVEYKSIHKPVVQGKCYLCHEIHKGRNKMFLLTDEKKDVCVTCHGEKLGAGHGAKLADCTSCHNAHISDKEGLFTDKGIKKCLECHKGLNYKKDLVQKSECQSCHNPHTGNNVELAKASCKNCHDQKKLTIKHNDVTPRYESCSNCHELHGDGGKGLLKKNMHPLKEKGCKGCHTDKDIETARNSCLECHADIYDEKHPNTIRNINGCLNCHKVHGGGVEKLLAENQHTPFREGKCVDCHKSIEDSLKLSEKAESGELCLSCHKDIDKNADDEPYTVLHKPFAKRECIKCHETHASLYPMLIRGVGAKFCYSCHKNFSLDEKGGAMYSVHAPISSGECLKCHSPHGSSTEKILRNTGQELCFGCHENFLIKKGKSMAQKAKGMLAQAVKQKENELPKFSTIHKPISEKGCIICHSPHSSKNKKLLDSKEGTFICYKCHEDFTLNDDGEKIGFVHEPVLKELCLNCHEQHANDNPKLLKELPNKLCEKCHKQRRRHHNIIKASLEVMIKIPDSFTLVGNIRLHCTNCHTPHSSETEFLFVKPKRELCTLCHKSVP